MLLAWLEFSFQVDCLSPLQFVILLEFHTFIWNVFLCHLILSTVLCLWSPFLRIQHCDSSWFSHPFVGEDDPGACAVFPVGGIGACPLLGGAGYCPSGGKTVSRHLFRDNYWLKTTLGSLSVVAPHSSTLAWKIPQMEEPGGLQSMGLRRVGHD